MLSRCSSEFIFDFIHVVVFWVYIWFHPCCGLLSLYLILSMLWSSEFIFDFIHVVVFWVYIWFYPCCGLLSLYLILSMLWSSLFISLELKQNKVELNVSYNILNVNMTYSMTHSIFHVCFSVLSNLLHWVLIDWIICLLMIILRISD